MSWIDDINKKLQEQRDSFKESIDSGEARARKSRYTGTLSKTRHDSEYQSKVAKGNKGGKIAHAAMIAKYGEEGYKAIMKERYDARDNTEFHKAGGKVGGKISGPKTGKLAVESGQLAEARINSKKSLREKRQKMCDEVYELLPSGWFSKKEALEIIPYSYKQFGRIIREYDADRYETKGNSSQIKYRKKEA